MSCCLLEGAHCPCFVQSELLFGNAQYILANLSGIVAVTVMLYLFCISAMAVAALLSDTGSVTLLNSSQYSYSSMLQCNQLIEGCHIFIFVANRGIIIHLNWTRIGKLPFIAFIVVHSRVLSITTKLPVKV